MACALGWLDFRFPAFDWRANRAALGAWYAGILQRRSLAQTMPSP
jgi:hypothetical protein